jgi:nucleoside-diphosphate-sugar epimerase
MMVLVTGAAGFIGMHFARWLLATNHDAFDYAVLAQYARLIVDTSGVYLDPPPNVINA